MLGFITKMSWIYTIIILMYRIHLKEEFFQTKWVT